VKPTQTGRSLSDEHEALFVIAQAVIDKLADLPQALAGSPWAHHHGYAKRAEWLGEHLEAAIVLAMRQRYASSLAVLRTALEQSCIDELLLLADRYRETIPADEQTFRQLEAEWKRGEADWTKSVVDLKHDNKTVRLVRTGHPILSPDHSTVVEHLSPYAPAVDQHDAMLGPPDVQDDLAGAFSNPERLKEWAIRNRSTYRRFLRWSAITDNLQLNELMSDHQALELETHYRFLSTFTHATTAGYRALDRQRRFPGAQSLHEHLLGELVLLYVAAIGATELRSFTTYVDARPELELTTRSDVQRVVSAAVQTAGYFWFPRLGSPVAYDFFVEANRRAYPNGRFERDEHAPRPEEIPGTDVSYYANPLGRLEQLHTGGAEVATGYSHSSLWP
jgi:hypothetical protein